MKNILYVVLIVALLCSCIGQKKVAEEPELTGETGATETQGWTVDQWKEHLSFATFPLGQDPTSMIAGFRNVGDLPTGTRVAYNVKSDGIFQGQETTSDATMDLIVSGTEVVDGITCTVTDVATHMNVESEGSTMVITIEGKEWLDEEGVPVKVEEAGSMEFGEYSIPLSIALKRTGEEIYHGRDCWVFTGTQTMEILGMKTEGNITEYMDKETYAVVRTVSTIGDQNIDTGYMEPPKPPETQEWELDGRESVTTPAGTYDCQVIYLKENGKQVGTIWANEDVSVPIKYTFTYEAENTSMEVTAILIAYTLGT